MGEGRFLTGPNFPFIYPEVSNVCWGNHVTCMDPSVPFFGQVIWHGKTERAIGGLVSDTTLQFTFSGTRWCSEKTLPELLTLTDGHVVRNNKRAQHYIFLLDLYSVHRSKSVITHIKAKLPWCKLVFIPPHFTGLRAAECFARQVVHQEVGGIDVRIGAVRPLLNRWLRESMAEVGANLDGRHYIAPTDDVWAAWVVDVWRRHADGTLFKEKVAAEQGDQGAGLEELEAQAVPLVGGGAVGDSDADESCWPRKMP